MGEVFRARGLDAEPEWASVHALSHEVAPIHRFGLFSRWAKPIGMNFAHDSHLYDVYNFQVVSCVMAPSVSISVRGNYNILIIEKARDNRHDADLGLVPWEIRNARNPRPVANV
jgi:hypothetical protein